MDRDQITLSETTGSCAKFLIACSHAVLHALNSVYLDNEREILGAMLASCNFSLDINDVKKIKLPGYDPSVARLSAAQTLSFASSPHGEFAHSSR
jgi:hypothetical protein